MEYFLVHANLEFACVVQLKVTHMHSCQAEHKYMHELTHACIYHVIVVWGRDGTIS